MSFEDIIEGFVGKEVRVRSPEGQEIIGVMKKIDGDYCVGEFYTSLPLDEVDSVVHGRRDIMLEKGSRYFEGGLIN